MHIQKTNLKIVIFGVICSFLCCITLAKDSVTYKNPIVIICSTDNPENSFHVFALKKFAHLIKQYSKGQLNAEIHYKGSKDFPAIKGEEAASKLVMLGEHSSYSDIPVHITVMASGNASYQMHILEFLSLPYFFLSTESAKILFRSDFMDKVINQQLIKRYGVRSLGWLIGGYRHLTNSLHPVESIKDLKGLRIRTPRNYSIQKTYSALGAEVKPISWANTFNALKEESVDGQENPFNVIYYSKFWHANQQYITISDIFLWVGPILINENFFKNLSIENQKIVSRAAKEAVEAQWSWTEKKNNFYKRRLIKNGMQIFDIKDKNKWVKASLPIWESQYKAIGNGDYQQGKKIVEKALFIMNE